MASGWIEECPKCSKLIRCPSPDAQSRVNFEFLAKHGWEYKKGIGWICPKCAVQTSRALPHTFRY